MSEDQKSLLKKKLRDIANELRGKMDADQFRDYILGFIFYKYLSEKIELYANDLLENDAIQYNQIQETTTEGKSYIDAIRKAALDKLGYFLKPSELFHSLAEKGNNPDGKTDNFILEDLKTILNNIEQSTM